MSLAFFSELLNGALKSNLSTIARKKINHLASVLPILGMTVDVAKMYASIRRKRVDSGSRHHYGLDNGDE